MKKRVLGYGLWLLLAGCLYFFENNTGTRALLLASALLPLIPGLRRAFFGPDAAASRPPEKAEPPLPAEAPEAEEGELRPWQPGDPVNRIHWKQSARQRTLIFRPLILRTITTDAANSRAESPFPDAPLRGATLRGAEIPQTAVTNAGISRAENPTPVALRRKTVILSGLLLFLLCALLLAALPSGRAGFLALLNGLYTRSEAVNAYVYPRFPVPEGQDTALTWVLLSLGGAGLLTAAVACSRRLPLLALGLGAALFQIYFGLSLPPWANLLLFTLLALLLARRPLGWKNSGRIAVFALAVFVATLLIWPGTDAATETASERVRDWLSATVQGSSGSGSERPAGETETRHTHPRALTEGDEAGRPDRAFRLETEEEQPISRPPWTETVRILLLALGSLALVTLPFVPFLLLNARRKKARALRQAMEEGPPETAVCLLFQQGITWITALGEGAGNRPYAEWENSLRARLGDDYGDRFAAGAKRFEEAAYSDHPLPEEARAEALVLLRETQEKLWQLAGRCQRLRLRLRGDWTIWREAPE